MDVCHAILQEISNTFEDYHSRIQSNRIVLQQQLTELAEKLTKRNSVAPAETLESPWISNENPLNLSARLILKEFHADETHHNTDEEEKRASLVADVPCSPKVTNLQLLSGDDSPKSSIGDYGVEKSATERLLPKSVLEQGEVGAIYKVSLKGNSTAQVGGENLIAVKILNFVSIQGIAECKAWAAFVEREEYQEFWYVFDPGGITQTIKDDPWGQGSQKGEGNVIISAAFIDFSQSS